MNRKSKRFKHAMFLVLAAGMLLYAVPRLHAGQGFALPSLFTAAWIGFALLVFAAHLHRLLGVDRVTEAQLTAVERMRRRQAEQRLRRFLPSRK